MFGDHDTGTTTVSRSVPSVGCCNRPGGVTVAMVGARAATADDARAESVVVAGAGTVVGIMLTAAGTSTSMRDHARVVKMRRSCRPVHHGGRAGEGADRRQGRGPRRR